MKCLHCGKELPEGAKSCPECGKVTGDTPAGAVPPRLNRDAIVSFVLALLAPVLLSCPGGFALVGLLALPAAFILGVSALVRIVARDEGRGEWMAVFGVLLSILWFNFLPAFLPRPGQELPRRSVCISNLKQIGLALKMYAYDFNEMFPCDSSVAADRRTVSALSLLVPEYAEDFRAFRCPSDKNWGKPGSTAASVYGRPYNQLDNKCSYAYAYLCNEQTDDETIIMADRSWQSERATVNSPWAWSESGIVEVGGLKCVNHGSDGVNVLRKGGDAKWIPAARIATDVYNLGYDTDGNRHIDTVGQLYNP